MIRHIMCQYTTFMFVHVTFVQMWSMAEAQVSVILLGQLIRGKNF